MTSRAPAVDALANALIHLHPDASRAEALQARLTHFSAFPAFWQHCLRHGIAPLVFRNLKQLRLLSLLPKNARDMFAQAYYRTLTNNLSALDALQEIARNLPDGLPVAILKGPTLFDLIYGNPGLRPISDIDILVPSDRRGETHACLARLGYAPNAQYPEIFTRDTLILDLHTDVINASRIAARSRAIPLPEESLWQNMQPIPDLAPLLRLGLADQIVTLAIHGLKHGFDRKIWLIDLLGCLSKIPDAESADLVIERARAIRAERILAISTHAIEIRLDQSLPPHAANLQKSFPIGPISLKILRIGDIPGPFQFLEPLVMFQNLEGVRAKAGYLWEIAFPKPDVMSQISGLRRRTIFWLSYPYRLIQLATLGVAQLARLLVRGLRRKPR